MLINVSTEVLLEENVNNDNDSNIIIGSYEYQIYDSSTINYDFDSFVHLINYDGSLMALNNNQCTYDTSNNISHSYYFNNLISNFGNNTDGTCGYIAIATLLSYYNYFYNSDFIDENLCNNTSFEINSVFNSIYLDEFTESPGYNDSFHQFLIESIGYDILNYDAIPFLSNIMPINRQVDVLNQYLINYTNVSNMCTITTQSGINSKNMILEEISNGFPLLITLDSWECIYENNGQIESALYYGCPHVMIVYGYGYKDGDLVLKCHSGWHNDSRIHHSMIVKPYNWDSISVLKFSYVNEIHKCENNGYKFKHKDSCDGFSLCCCKQSYSCYCEYVENSCTEKSYVCPKCNDSLYSNTIYNHLCVWNNTVSTHHGICSKCNMEIQGEHVFKYNSKKETYVCLVCNYTTNIVPTIKFSIPLEILKTKTTEELLQSEEERE